MNYDFKTNWNDVVLPLLSMPSIKKSIKKGITKFINDGQSDEIYDSKKCPASYSSNDSWYTHLEDFKEKLTNTLTETGFLKQPPIIDDDIEFDECLECLQFNYPKVHDGFLRCVRAFYKTSRKNLFKSISTVWCLSLVEPHI